MALYDKASLVLIPSGTKEGVLFSQKPTNGDGDFTFSRSTSATRVGPSGYIEKETQNLLLQSNQFDTTWATTNTSVTGGQSGYDGTNDAWLLNRTSTSGYIRQSVSSSNLQTISIYVKTGTLDWVALTTSAANTSVWFDILNGTIGTTQSAVINANIQSVDNGYYRCSIVINASISAVDIYPAPSDASVSGSTGNIYIQDAQLEQGLVARDYIETTTSAVYGGITDNIPRLDYNGSCPSLLLEPQRTNLFEQSEYFGAWSANPSGISSIESNYAISPEGLQNAYKVNFVVQSDSDLALVEGHSVTGGSTYAYSIYIKGEGSDIGKDIVIKSKRSGGDSAGTTTLQTLTGEWKRIDFTTTYAANNAAANFYISSNDATSCLIYGAQAELGSYATSYIPTYGSAVTKNNDVCNGAGNTSTFNDSEGVLYAEIAALSNDNTIRMIQISDGSNGNRVIVYYKNGGTINGAVASGGSTVADIPFSATFTNTNKVAIRYKLNDVSLWINGAKVGQNLSAPAPIGLDRLSFNQDGGANYFYGKTNQVLYFPTALTDEELAALTTI